LIIFELKNTIDAKNETIMTQIDITSALTQMCTDNVNKISKLEKKISNPFDVYTSQHSILTNELIDD